ncbi:MAG: efflux RND transporter periplasmic adaptor subunit, partial [Burkholderiales bacterium]|nr:efflux RND transporter periplasmic adaptor subunit [Burkholderiales bacterium]
HFPARVERVSFGSTTISNVVTYTTDLSVDNADLSLRPGMTATASITATERKGVLRVPNTALRFAPASAPAAAPAASGGGLVSRMLPRPPPAPARRPREAGGPGPEAERQIWVVQDGQPAPITVQVGISDGRLTEVSGPELREGMRVITDQKAQ